MVYFLFIETRGSTLEEIVTSFDSPEQIDHLRAIALEKQAEVEAEHIEIDRV